MFTTDVVVNAVLALGMAWCAFAEFTRFGAIPAQMTKAHVPLAWLPWLASVKVVVLVGIGIGYFVPVVGTVAAAGVSLYFVGAIGKHLMAHDANVGGAIFFLLLASAALTVHLAAASAYGLGVLAG